MADGMLTEKKKKRKTGNLPRGVKLFVRRKSGAKRNWAVRGEQSSERGGYLDHLQRNWRTRVGGGWSVWVVR